MKRILSCCLILAIGLAMSGCGVITKTTSASAMEDVSAEDYFSKISSAGGEYELARQSGVLEKDWREYTVKLNSVVLTLPCSVTYLEGVGLKMDTSFMAADSLVNYGNRESVYFENGRGDAILVTLMNPDRKPKALSECLVTGIAVTNLDLCGGYLTVTFPGEIELGSHKSDAIIAYGSDYEEYQSEAVHMYTWHDPNSYYKSCEIDYDAETLEASGMFLNY